MVLVHFWILPIELPVEAVIAEAVLFEEIDDALLGALVAQASCPIEIHGTLPRPRLGTHNTPIKSCMLSEVNGLQTWFDTYEPHRRWNVQQYRDTLVSLLLVLGSHAKPDVGRDAMRH